MCELLGLCVPNVPCGVESRGSLSVPPNFPKPFLMYRVELKVRLFLYIMAEKLEFLMYRVELKGTRNFPKS